MLRKILPVILSLTVLLAALGAAALYWFVVVRAGNEIRQESIRKILAMETPVYYQDGQTKIGVFFKDAHRQYIPYDEIPKNFVNAIVAAEDNTFFSHHGVDIFGIMRALLANIRAGRIVQGGSTITQQAAKNLFKRKDRSLVSKLKELVFALQLEYHYSKEKIIEFYANQFYVSGNGHGLGVAARYYFDKPVSELDLLECAFIAGSVKRPNYYNPFIQENEVAAEQAKARAKQRTAYVLLQMYRLGMIDADRYQEELLQDIPFHKGKMQYPLNTLMDLVKKALNTNEVVEALAQHGIENIATSGISIITTIDRDLQASAEYALGKELSRLDVRLSGYDPEELRIRYANLALQSGQPPEPGTFLFGWITGIKQGDAPSVAVSFDSGEQGRIDEAGLKPLLSSLAKWKGQRWSTAGHADLVDLLAGLRVGDKVFVSIREMEPATGEFLLDLEKYPELQGAVLTRQEGVIRAMVGGMENHFFNRAISAKRPMGSVMKPMVYAAALQLGWNIADALNNERNVFIYQGLPYFPRPDHFSPYPRISMNWAGARSENVATVWLLYHLCDQLTPGEFGDLAAHVGMGRQENESYERYKARIRDTYGIVVDQDALHRAAFNNAVKELETDLIFSGRLQEYELLKTLHYGLNFDKFSEELEEMAAKEDDANARERERLAREVEIRRHILARNFLSFKALRQEVAGLESDPSRYGSEQYNGSLYRNRLTADYIYTADLPESDDWIYIGPDELEAVMAQVRQTEWLYSPDMFWNSVLIGGMLSIDTIDQLESYTEKEYERLSGLLPYSAEVLHTIRDFRVAVGLHYLVDLGHALGITSTLDPVLSFPLGSNVISPLETARVYEGLANGGIFVDREAGISDELAIIARIEDSDGDLIFQPERKLKKIFDQKTTVAVTHILRNVVKFGTGHAADRGIVLQSRDPEKEKQLSQLNLRVPVFGKTGTANRFTNSAFAGYVPAPAAAGSGLTITGGYTLTAYVGFDDNAPMVRTSTHITGASGALPLWIRVANSILLQENYAAGLDLIDVTFYSAMTIGRPALPLLLPDLGQIELRVNENTGLPLPKVDQATAGHELPATAMITTFGKLKTDHEFAPFRRFRPYWTEQ